MWALRILSGTQAGKIHPLKGGSYIIGRGVAVGIQILEQGVSKEHAKIDVLNDKLIITDLDSLNGTYVNGKKIRSHRIAIKDKISIHNVFFDLIDMADHAIVPHESFNQSHNHGQGRQSEVGLPPAYDGSSALQLEPHSEGEQQLAYDPQGPNSKSEGSHSPRGWEGIVLSIKNYLDEIVLPGLYKLPQIMDFKWVLILFMFGYIFLVTSLSSIPMMRIVKSKIQMESQRRAQTIAKSLVLTNRPSLMQGIESAVSTSIADSEVGVKKSYIISNIDGHIIAPASKAGDYPKLPYVHVARKMGKASVKQVDDSTIVALAPIEFYNTQTGSQNISAWAVVYYNMDSLAVDDEEAISLYIQTFFIALFIGAIIFFFLYKLIEFPFLRINSGIDRALVEQNVNLDINFRFPTFEKLLANVNTILGRIQNSDAPSDSGGQEHDRQHELSNLVQLMGFPALGITAHDQVIASVNASFSEKLGLDPLNLVQTPLSQLTDQALKLNLQDLIEQSMNLPDQVISGELEFSGLNHEILVQAIYGSSEVAYFLVLIIPLDNNEGEE